MNQPEAVWYRPELTSQHQRALALQREEEDKRRLRARLLEKLVDDLGPRYSPERVSLDNYHVRHPGQKETLERVRAIAARLADSVKAAENVIFFGSPGTGKDHLQASLLHLATGTHGIAARHISGPEFYETKMRHLFCHANILAISDPVLPAADAPGWRVNQLHGLIDDCYNRLKPVWITVNVNDPKDLADKLSVQTYDRLRERAHLFPCFWPSYREALEPDRLRLRKSS
jgi:DNA replication protein DnaC